MCTMDYVDAVLFQLRWETIADRDGYFMGLYDKPYSSDDASDEAERMRYGDTSL